VGATEVISSTRPCRRGFQRLCSTSHPHVVVGLEGVAEGQQNHQVEEMPLAFDQGIGAEVAAHGQAGRERVEGIDALCPAQPAPDGAPLASPKAKRA